MKHIGIIGGLGAPSTAKYYQWLNEAARALGGHMGARVILTSVDGQDIAGFRFNGDDEGEEAFFVNEAKRLERAGADFILIASNTSHKNADAIEREVSLPLLHLADATAKHLKAKGHDKVAFLGTIPAMEKDFYKKRIVNAGIDIIIPDEGERAYINEAIYDRLVWDKVLKDDSERFAKIIDGLIDKGAQGVILGCTELTLLNLENFTKAPLFDTVRIHVEAAMEMATN